MYYVFTKFQGISFILHISPFFFFFFFFLKLGQREISREETSSRATRRNEEQSTDLFRIYHILSEYIRPIGLFYYFFFSFKLTLL